MNMQIGLSNSGITMFIGSLSHSFFRLNLFLKLSPKIKFNLNTKSGFGPMLKLTSF